MQGAVLSRILWGTYILLGLSGSVVLVASLIPTVYPPNYLSTLFLAVCILTCIWAFRNVRADDVAPLAPGRFAVRSVENFLIAFQGFSIIFFLPFAVQALSGDPGEFRLALEDTQDILTSYGILNTIASHASHLFTASLVLAFLRLSSTDAVDRDIVRVGVLVVCSLSWVIYVLAYAGRDGIIYWVMTAAVVYLLFRQRLSPRDRARIARIAPWVGIVLFLPVFRITVSRFFGYDGGGFTSLFEYFGAQIQNFSDYSSLERPRTDGLMSLPKFYGALCEAVSASCATWPDSRPQVFEEYLLQGKEPWLFGTFVSDLVGDFGYLGTLLIICGFAAVVDFTCRYRQRGLRLSLSRLLFILLLFQVPYWGVFYFRFSIINGYLVVNSVLCLVLHFLEVASRGRRQPKFVRTG
jgi:oligosaccharide repeat unit polymerase